MYNFFELYEYIILTRVLVLLMVGLTQVVLVILVDITQATVQENLPLFRLPHLGLVVLYQHLFRPEITKNVQLLLAVP